MTVYLIVTYLSMYGYSLYTDTVKWYHIIFAPALVPMMIGFIVALYLEEDGKNE